MGLVGRQLAIPSAGGNIETKFKGARGQVEHEREHRVVDWLWSDQVTRFNKCYHKLQPESSALLVHTDRDCAGLVRSNIST
jgi:hypothetical protein